MERRLRRVEATFAPTLRDVVAVGAAEHGLNPDVVLAEAERILAEVRAGRVSVAELVADAGLDPDGVQARASALLARVTGGRA